MVLIESSTADYSTSQVIDWLRYKSSEKIIRLDDEIEIESLSLYIGENERNSSITFKMTSPVILSSINSNWYRRGDFRFLTNNISNQQNPIINYFKKYQLSHNNAVIDFLTTMLPNSLNKLKDNNLNKLIVLSAAYDLGLNIPSTIITNKIEDLIQFSEKNNYIITKSIIDSTFSFPVSSAQTVIASIPSVKMSYSELLADSHRNAPIGLSFAQEYIDKKYEIRTFYIQGDFFSMAIFSQSDINTQIDYRNRPSGNPNRCVPFVLPFHIECKLKQLFDELNINCGSTDIIYTPNEEYVFLEINPIGQYDWVSKLCNYFIDEKIADYLLSY